MDETFAKQIAEATSDAWRLKTTPSFLSSISAEDFTSNFKHMDVQTKVCSEAIIHSRSDCFCNFPSSVRMSTNEMNQS